MNFFGKLFKPKRRELRVSYFFQGGSGCMTIEFRGKLTEEAFKEIEDFVRTKNPEYDKLFIFNIIEFEQ